AVWMYRIGLDYILGFQTSLKGIKIEPNIPTYWEKYSVTRKFRNKTINLTVNNPNKVNNGIKEIYVNNNLLNNSFIEVDKYAEDTINIKVILGKHE
ncbi:MAG TPA: glycosyl transferase family 36, partial [Melioribacteraceae bacterium]|nr:glycosyl transferase family 36 [Melioribacteraceae bacterium]